MFIKKVTLDGFKSYGKKVELTGFDPSFNAITGFNGSGKSNILDAICFVLGLSKLDVARCHSLNDLIYKNGQAGVTTASVTIEIDNSDNKFGRSEYNNTIVVRREVNLKNQSKFYIDGFSVQKEKLLDFFQSVSLNIQNPHFLIMQGKIVKVSAMKPVEILSMIEETVGVSIYEHKKKQTIHKIERYDISLNEIKEIIDISINPKLKQLKEEEKSLTEYRNVAAEFDSCQKIYTAYRYLKDKDIVDNADRIIAEKNESISIKDAESETLNEELSKVSKEIKRLEQKKSEESGGNLKELEGVLKEKRKKVDTINTNKKLKIDNIKEDESKKSKLKKKFDSDNKNLQKKKTNYEKVVNNVNKLREENDNNKKNSEQAEKDFQGITMGLSKGLDGEEATTLAQQISAANEKLSLLNANSSKSKLKRENTQKELNQKKGKVRFDQGSYEKCEKEIEMKKKDLADLQNELDQIDFTEERFNELKSKAVEYKREQSQLNEEMKQRLYEVPLADFKYDRNNTKIDDGDIEGLVCKLFTLKKPEYAMAIEKVCGGKLFNVVVSNERVAKHILDHGRLKERRTFLPMNKIKGRDKDPEALRIARALVGRDNVDYAINLVDYKKSLDVAMRHVFGDTLVCKDIDMAKKVAFAQGVHKRTITYDGEIIDPSGVLTGGSVRQKVQVLKVVSELIEIEEKLNLNKIKIEQNDEELDRLKEFAKPYHAKKSQYIRTEQEINILQQNLTESNHHVLMEELNLLKAVIEEENKNLAEIENEISVCNQHKIELENKINNADSIREKELKDAEEIMKKSKKRYENSTKELQKEEQSLTILTQELQHHEKELADLDEELNKLDSVIGALQGEVNAFDEELNIASKDVEEAESAYNECKTKVTAQSDEIKQHQKKYDTLQNSIEENAKQVKILQHEIDKIKISIKEAKTNLKNTLHKNAWIHEEEGSFNSLDSEYRILHNNFDVNEFQTKLASLKSQKTALSKKVNLKANIMHGEKQKEFDDLLKKRDIIIQDRKKLTRYIENVEKEKDNELGKAWQKINHSFGHIFNTLLPGACCKLVQVSSRVKDGLEIKVKFDSVWKESLSELSGGQRSLVALSLVLALLKYNPAPLYILDEVDAALDQSHTQNIGLMIKQHFKNSQFIIVSLKDDMFSNANVLFQTKFIDGYSTVMRRG